MPRRSDQAVGRWVYDRGNDDPTPSNREGPSVRWQELCDRQPRLGELARQRLIEPGVLLVVTLRRDGTPRLSPVEPWLMDGELWLSMLWGSLKARDLHRDARILVHSIVTNRE